MEKYQTRVKQTKAYMSEGRIKQCWCLCRSTRLSLKAHDAQKSFLRTEKSQCHYYLQEGQDDGFEALQVKQPHLYLQEGDEANNPGNCSYAYQQEVDLVYSTQIIESLCLTNLTAFNKKNICSVGEGREVDVVHLDFSRAFNTFTVSSLKHWWSVDQMSGQGCGVDTTWASGFKGLWSKTWSPAGGQTLVWHSRNENFIQYILTSSFMTWMIGQSAPSPVWRWYKTVRNGQ